MTSYTTSANQWPGAAGVYQGQYMDWMGQPSSSPAYAGMGQSGVNVPGMWLLPMLDYEAQMQSALIDQETQLELQRRAMPGAQQLLTTLGRFKPSDDVYRQFATDGGWNQSRKDRVLSSINNMFADGARATNEARANMLSSAGLGLNPFAAEATERGSTFAASRARGDALAGIEQQQIQGQLAGAQGLASNATAAGNFNMMAVNDPQNLTSDPYGAATSGGKYPPRPKPKQYGGGSSFKPGTTFG